MLKTMFHFLQTNIKSLRSPTASLRHNGETITGKRIHIVLLGMLGLLFSFFLFVTEWFVVKLLYGSFAMKNLYRSFLLFISLVFIIFLLSRLLFTFWSRPEREYYWNLAIISSFSVFPFVFSVFIINLFNAILPLVYSSASALYFRSGVYILVYLLAMWQETRVFSSWFGASTDHGSMYLFLLTIVPYLLLLVLFGVLYI